VNEILVVDDASSDDTSEVVSAIGDERIRLIRHDKNIGVGGSVVTGYKHALQGGADVVVKIDGDGQMNPRFIPKIIAPITEGLADYSKGFRFHDLENLRQMPKVRLIGNVVLSFLTKIVSGYWNIFDPTSGYTAIHKEALSRLDLERLHRGYFFETDMLIRLYKEQAVVRDVHIPNIYADEESQLKPFRLSLTFPWLFLKAFVKRILWRYFLADFTAVSLFILLGLPLFLFGAGFGLYHWVINAVADIPTPIGTVMIAVVTLFFGFEFLLQALVLDINNFPRTPLQTINLSIMGHDSAFN
jgi:glycosyltransferase involved in cell wall biosynthesis